MSGVTQSSCSLVGSSESEIVSVWNSILSILGLNHADCTAASEDEIATVESKMQIALPSDLKTLLRLQNGSSTLSGFPPMFYPSTHEMLEQFSYNDAFTQLYRTLQWIPMGMIDYDICWQVLDLRSNSVLQVDVEMETRTDYHLSIRQYLDNFLEYLKSKQQSLQLTTAPVADASDSSDKHVVYKKPIFVPDPMFNGSSEWKDAKVHLHYDAVLKNPDAKQPYATVLCLPNGKFMSSEVDDSGYGGSVSDTVENAIASFKSSFHYNTGRKWEERLSFKRKPKAFDYDNSPECMDYEAARVDADSLSATKAMSTGPKSQSELFQVCDFQGWASGTETGFSAKLNSAYQHAMAISQHKSSGRNDCN